MSYNNEMEVKQEIQRYLSEYNMSLSDEQIDIMWRSLTDEDLFISLRTCSDRKLIYFLPAMIQWNEWKKSLQGEAPLTLIISPLQRVMSDDSENINEYYSDIENDKYDSELIFETINYDDVAIKLQDHISCAVHSSMTKDERERSELSVVEGKAVILYLSPEALLFNRIVDLFIKRDVKRVIVDEAHMLKEWGHGFRTDYGYIAKFIRELELKERHKVSISCFSGTVTERVKREIENGFYNPLNKENGYKHVFKEYINNSRDNIKYYVYEIEDEKDYDSEDAIDELTKRKCNYLWNLMNPKNEERKIKDLIDVDEDGYYYVKSSAVIYTFYSDYSAKIAGFIETKIRELNNERIHRYYSNSFLSGDAQRLSDIYGWHVLRYTSFYNGKLEYVEKNNVAKRFINEQSKIIVADPSFGLGIDKSDIRFVINFDTPDSVDRFLSLSDIAGKDGKAAEYHTLFCRSDFKRIEYFNSINHISSSDVKDVWNILESMPIDRKGHTLFCINDIAGLLSHADSISDGERRVKVSLQELMNLGYVERSMNHKSHRKDGELGNGYYIKKKLIDHSRITQEEKKLLEKICEFIGMDYTITDKSMFRYQIILSWIKYLRLLYPKSNRYEFEYIVMNNPYFVMCKLNDEKDSRGKYIELNVNTNKLSWTYIQINNAIRNIFYNGVMNLFGDEIITSDDDEDAKRLRDNYPSSYRVSKVYSYSDSVDGLLIDSKKCREQYKKIFDDWKLIVNRSSNNTFKFGDVDPTTLQFLADCGLIDKGKDGLSSFMMDIILADKEYNPKEFESLEDNVVKREINKRKIMELYETIDINLSNQIEIREYICDYLSRQFDDELNDELSMKDRIYIHNGFPLDSGKVDALNCVLDNDSRMLLVHAGPGSGKTTFLAKKIYKLIKKDGYIAKDILALNFTRKAKARLEKCVFLELNDEIKDISFHTFHSFSNVITGNHGGMYDEAIRNACYVLEKEGDISDRRITSILKKKILIIDEAQDLNEVMKRLLVDIMSTNEDMILIAVMDSDQSIFDYEQFKDGKLLSKKSSPKYVMDMAEKYKAKNVNLLVNYRSKGNIVRFTEQFRKTMPGHLEREDMIAKDGINEGKVREFVVRESSMLIDELILRLINDVNSLIKSDARGIKTIGVLQMKKAYRDYIYFILKQYYHDEIAVRVLRNLNLGEHENLNYFPLYQLDEFYYLINVIDRERKTDDKGRKKDDISVKLIRFSLQTTHNEYIYSLYRGCNPSKMDYVEEWIEDYIARCSCNNMISFSHMIKTLKNTEFDDFINEYVNNINDNKDKPILTIIVSTIHSAKGMEFDAVYMSMEESDAFKQDNSDDSVSRIRYVGMTRSKSELNIFDSKEIPYYTDKPHEIFQNDHPDWMLHSLLVEKKNINDGKLHVMPLRNVNSGYSDHRTGRCPIDGDEIYPVKSEYGYYARLDMLRELQKIKNEKCSSYFPPTPKSFQAGSKLVEDKTSFTKYITVKDENDNERRLGKYAEGSIIGTNEWKDIVGAVYVQAKSVLRKVVIPGIWN